MSEGDTYKPEQIRAAFKEAFRQSVWVAVLWAVALAMLACIAQAVDWFNGGTG